MRMLRKPGLIVTSAACGALVLGTAGPAASSTAERNAAPPDAAVLAPAPDAPQNGNENGGLLGALSDVLHVVGDALKKDDTPSTANTKTEAQAIAAELAKLQGRDARPAPGYDQYGQYGQYDQYGLTGTDASSDVYAQADPYAGANPYAGPAPYAPANPTDADAAGSPEQTGTRAAAAGPRDRAIGDLHAKIEALVQALGARDRADVVTAAQQTLIAAGDLAKTIAKSPQQQPSAQTPAEQTPDVDY
ncbi:hypothetical protein [Streptomyces violens]|uniref:hypothetical protein n=1 Tax=Streptomyces violens TaxID=66377 RepID=UPI0004C1D8C7|nr:hypothetical protein [Streptomyces violens]